MRVLLVSMPWAPFHRPSIQLGALKSYLDGRLENIDVTTRHSYLEVAKAIGLERYRLIAARSWAGEALYAGLLFPEQRDSARRLFASELPRLGSAAWDELLPILSAQLDVLLDRELTADCTLVGLSVSFSQLAASLLAAKRIKERRPDLAIVLGGSALTPSMARNLPEAFPAVDCCICGEGEQPLLGLIAALAEAKTIRSASGQEPGLRTGDAPCPPPADQIADLDSLPVPDYSDYFQELARNGLAFIPELPVEFSRGCWWNRCSFCNLNLQWLGYRHKSHERMQAEVRTLAARHRCLDFSFTDNALPPAEARSFFREQAKESTDLRFFAEIRALPKPEEYGLLRRGGLTEVQIGVEALSDSLLARMRKGIRAIDNIAAMKHAQEHGLRLSGNLILEFPGSTAEEVKETLAALEALLPYPPLAAAGFFLGAQSPVYCQPTEFGITTIGHHPKNRQIFPAALLRRMEMLTMAARGDRGVQRRLWTPVRHAIRSWQDFHRGRDLGRPALSYRDGGDFLVIRQELPGQPVLHHRLQGLSREIYLHCHRPVARKQLPQTFKRVKEEQLACFLADLQDKHLLFQDRDHCLALAVRST